METDDVSNEYSNIYKSLYQIIKLVSDRMQLNLVACDIQDGTAISNLDSIAKALKNSYPSYQQLFKKFPLRKLSYINPKSSATMKSVTKHLEAKRLSAVKTDDGWSIQTCSTDESITASTMRLMALFQKFIETCKSQILFMSLEERLKKQMSDNTEIQKRISKLINRLKNIWTADKPSRLKLEESLTVLENVKDKNQVINVGLLILQEWIPECPKSYDELSSDICSSNDAIKDLDSILSLMRLLPMESDWTSDQNLLDRTIAVIQSYTGNKLIVPSSLSYNLCRLAHTLICGLGNNVKNQVKTLQPTISEFLVKLRKSYKLDLTAPSKIVKMPNSETEYPLLDKVLDMIVNGQEITKDTMIEMLNCLPIDRQEIYKNLREKNIDWSDRYIDELYTEFQALSELSK